MRKIVKQVISSFLLLVLFISTTGFSVFSHLCLMSGDKTTEVMQPVKSCCEDVSAKELPASGSQIQKPSCCKDAVTYVKFNFEALREQAQILHIELAVFDVADFHAIHFPAENTFHLHAQNLPPPKPGRDILLQTDLLRI